MTKLPTYSAASGFVMIAVAHALHPVLKEGAGDGWTNWPEVTNIARDQVTLTHDGPLSPPPGHPRVIKIGLMGRELENNDPELSLGIKSY